MAEREVIYDVGAHEGEDTEFYLKKGFSVLNCFLLLWFGDARSRESRIWSLCDFFRGTPSGSGHNI
jgi:hypothetical protein